MAVAVPQQSARGREASKSSPQARRWRLDRGWTTEWRFHVSTLWFKRTSERRILSAWPQQSCANLYQPPSVPLTR
jgi:hypothetical protein